MLRFMLKTFLILAIEVPNRIALGDLLCVLRNISTGDLNSVNLYTIVQQYLHPIHQQETPEHLVLADL
jgi:hypothetical protein